MAWTREQIIAAIQERRRRGLPLIGVWQENVELYEAADREFSGWHRAVAAAGIFRNRQRLWTKELILDAIQYWHHAGVPVHTLYRRDPPLVRTALSYFQKWSTAVAAAGIEMPPRRRWNRHRVIEELRHHFREGPVNIYYADRQLWKHAIQLFGDVDTALQAAGLTWEPNKWPKRRILATIQDKYVRGLCPQISGFGDRSLTHAARREFGSWQAALEAAGIKIQIKKRRYWSKETVVAELRRHVSETGLTFVPEKNRSLYAVAVKYFGNWMSALAAAGLQSPRRRWSQAAVIQHLRERLEQGLSLSAGKVHLEDHSLVAAARHYCGSWQNALALIGVAAKTRRWSRQLIVEELRRRASAGLSLSSTFIRYHEDPNLIAAANRHFGGWRLAKAAAGVVGPVGPRSPSASDRAKRPPMEPTRCRRRRPVESAS